MGISVKRIILTIILAVLFVIAFGWVIMMQNHATLVSSQSVDETLRREEFMQAKNDIEFAWRIMEKDIREQYQVDAALLAVALRNIIEESEDEAIALYSSGAVIKVENGKITAPEETDRKLGLAGARDCPVSRSCRPVRRQPGPFCIPGRSQYSGRLQQDPRSLLLCRVARGYQHTAGSGGCARYPGHSPKGGGGI